MSLCILPIRGILKYTCCQCFTGYYGISDQVYARIENCPEGQAMYLASVCGAGCTSLDEVEHGHLCLSRGPTVRAIAVQGGRPIGTHTSEIGTPPRQGLCLDTATSTRCLGSARHLSTPRRRWEGLGNQGSGVSFLHAPELVTSVSPDRPVGLRMGCLRWGVGTRDREPLGYPGS